MVVTGCCFEFFGPLLDLFLKSVVPSESDPVLSAEDIREHLTFLRLLHKQIDAKPASDRFIEYKFSIYNDTARVEIETNITKIAIANLKWLPGK